MYIMELEKECSLNVWFMLYISLLGGRSKSFYSAHKVHGEPPSSVSGERIPSQLDWEIAVRACVLTDPPV